MLELPVIRVFPNDYRAICRSVETAKLLSKTSELGKAFAQFADTLMGQPAERPSKWANKGTKFLEFVAELPAHALPGREEPVHNDPGGCTPSLRYRGTDGGGVWVGFHVRGRKAVWPAGM